MITKTESLEAYKKAIRAHYEIEKQGKYSSFLIKPSRAKLRQLCEERLKESNDKDDKLSFNLVFGFEYEASNRNKLKSLTDKFRPIETFLKGETDLSDIEAINITEILVNFKPRPFRFFNIKSFGNQSLNEEEEIEEEEKNKEKKNEEKKNKTHLEIETTEPRNNLKKKISIGLIGLSSIGYTAKSTLFSNKECMQWQKNHYEYVDCDKKGLLELYPIIPVDESLINLRKIEVSKETPFFCNGKPNIWYFKRKNGEVEFYNSHGIHPETGKPLKAITNYMIEKYVK